MNCRRAGGTNPVAGDARADRPGGERAVAGAVDEIVTGELGVPSADERHVRAGEAAHLEASDGDVVHRRTDVQDAAVLDHEVRERHVVAGNADPRFRVRSGESRAEVHRWRRRRHQHRPETQEANAVGRHRQLLGVGPGEDDDPFARAGGVDRCLDRLTWSHDASTRPPGPMPGGPARSRPGRRAASPQLRPWRANGSHIGALVFLRSIGSARLPTKAEGTNRRFHGSVSSLSPARPRPPPLSVVPARQTPSGCWRPSGPRSACSMALHSGLSTLAIRDPRRCHAAAYSAPGNGRR